MTTRFLNSVNASIERHCGNATCRLFAPWLTFRVRKSNKMRYSIRYHCDAHIPAGVVVNFIMRPLPPSISGSTKP